MDQLSLCVSGVGQRLASVITLDELIVFVDDNGEVTKGATTKIRRLRGAKISCLAGVQLDCLPDVFSGSVGRNTISRFTVIATVYQLHVRLCLAFVEVFFSGHLGILWPLRFGCFCCRQTLRWEPARPRWFPLYALTMSLCESSLIMRWQWAQRRWHFVFVWVDALLLLFVSIVVLLSFSECLFCSLLVFLCGFCFVTDVPSISCLLPLVCRCVHVVCMVSCRPGRASWRRRC